MNLSARFDLMHISGRNGLRNCASCEAGFQKRIIDGFREILSEMREVAEWFDREDPKKLDEQTRFEWIGKADLILEFICANATNGIWQKWKTVSGPPEYAVFAKIWAAFKGDEESRKFIPYMDGYLSAWERVIKKEGAE